ncbi:hypothetical protein EJB05_25270, partial [Eragrostis curvula]
MSSLTTAGSSMEECSVEEFDTRLSLEIGGTSSRPPPPPQRQTVQLFGELISPQETLQNRDHRETAAPVGKKKRSESGAAIAAVNFGSRSNKKARTSMQAEDGDRRSSQSDGGGGSRKKLRLTSGQATMLEDTFRAHNILSHAQKHELARRVGLSARQVEVWFQNRRARTKLKQTEVDCELLRRWCDSLTDENARLRRDLAELRAAAASTARLPAAAAAVSVVCPSCCDKKIAIVAGDVA